MKDGTQTPLVVDIDGSLLRTDMLLESFWTALGKDPYAALQAAYKNIGNRARLKHELAKLSDLEVTRLPVNDEVLDLATAARDDGRDVVLASGSDQDLVLSLIHI